MTGIHIFRYTVMQWIMHRRVGLYQRIITDFRTVFYIYSHSRLRQTGAYRQLTFFFYLFHNFLCDSPFILGGRSNWFTCLASVWYSIAYYEWWNSWSMVTAFTIKVFYSLIQYERKSLKDLSWTILKKDIWATLSTLGA